MTTHSVWGFMNSEYVGRIYRGAGSGDTYKAYKGFIGRTIRWAALSGENNVRLGFSNTEFADIHWMDGISTTAY